MSKSHLLIRLSNPAENPTLGVDPKQAVKTAAGWVKILGGWGGPDRSWSCIVPSHDETKRRDESGEKATEEMPSTGGWSTWSG